ncbi:MAG: 2-amino-4-hydroxy-6-hydroxymethyldihydropteridine diphosphokinase [Campylobacterales bacterium]
MRPKRTGRYRVLIGVGGNVGDVARRFRKLYRYLDQARWLKPEATAPLYHNPPFGYLDQPPFLNTLLLGRTSLSSSALLRRLLWTEKRFGRQRSFKNAPRTLDLDIIFFETKVVYNEKLRIPHPEWRARASVLVPLVALEAYRRRMKR